MSLRSFVDSVGDEWDAFDVVPRREERRVRSGGSERRVSGETRLEESERRDFDRRVTVGRSAAIAGAKGWLCFEHGTDRRRLSPIPPNWLRCDDAQLEAYLQAARPVRRNSMSLEQIADRQR
jgi:hypothetical protein